MWINPTWQLSEMLTRAGRVDAAIHGFDIDDEYFRQHAVEIYDSHPELDKEQLWALTAYSAYLHPNAPHNCVNSSRQESPAALLPDPPLAPAPRADIAPLPWPPEFPNPTPAINAIAARIGRQLWIIAVILALAILLAPHLHAQGSDKLVIQLQNNGANLGTAGGLLKINCGAATYSANVYTCTSAVPANGKVRAFGVTFDGGGSALSSGVTRYLTVPFGCTISAWNIAVDTGTATIKTWKIATGTAIPTVSNSISTSGVAISSGTAIHSTTVSDFTSVTVNANDILGFNLFAVSGTTQLNFILECDQ